MVDTKDPFSPPPVILNYPTLGVLTNGYLTLLNELRHCAPIVMQQKLAEILRESFVTIARALQQFQKEPLRKLEKEEEAVYSAMCQVRFCKSLFVF